MQGFQGGFEVQFDVFFDSGFVLVVVCSQVVVVGQVVIGKMFLFVKGGSYVQGVVVGEGVDFQCLLCVDQGQQ